MPGMILYNYGTLDVLLANLSSRPITLHQKQIIAYLHLIHNSNIFNIKKMGTLVEFNLPSTSEEIQ